MINNWQFKVIIFCFGLFGFIFAACSDSATGKNSKNSDKTDTATDSSDADSDSGETDNTKSTDSDSAADSSDTAGNSTDSECVSDVVNCEMQCGKIRDICTNELHDCGGCDVGFVCDIVTNKCVDPLISCEDLGAECGTIRNSCGVRLDCGYCASGEECDADSNKCVKCTEPTCQDLGIECGSSWNGCGIPSDSTDTLDCGNCEDKVGMVCNSSYNICEPDCTPESKDVVCANVECGYVTDGCGGIVNCGNDCPAGTYCGVRGVANICSTPERDLECDVAGWECGTKQSACGETLNCGTCSDPDICLDNHLCGPPCTTLTCETGYAGKCGQKLDDGCGGTSLDCPCGDNLGCDAVLPGETGECKPLFSCADYTDGGNEDLCSTGASADFLRGDGVNLTCNCQGGRLCIDSSGNLVTGSETGTCCTNTDSCSSGNGCTATNTCTNEVSNCCNPVTQFCKTSTDKCIDKLTCSEIDWGGDFADGTVGSPCSNNGNDLFNDGSGDLIACPCNAGLVCVGGNGTSPGTCCQNTNTCSNTDLDENCEVPNSCAGGPAIACCGSSECCDSGSASNATDNQCVAANTCGDFTTGDLGDQCSRSNFFRRCPATSNDNSLLRCGCDGGMCCDEDIPPLISGPPGECVATTACDGSSCTVTNPCTGNVTNCCSSSQYCDTGTDKCVDKATCSTYTDRHEGDLCSDVKNDNFPVGDGTFLKCKCITSGGWTNLNCPGDSATQTGTCTCTPNVCTCANTGSYDGCGTMLNCPCSGTEVCNTAENPPVCCEPYVCTTASGGECGIPHDSCGSTVTCGCPDQYETCGGGGTANVCGCTPVNPCAGHTGWIENNCGTLVNCGG